MIVTFSSVRGSPGVTSWSLLIAAAWPQPFGVERVVLEADLDGGVLGARYGLGVEPGVAGLVAAVRRHRAGSVFDLSAFARQMSGGVWVVPEPESAEQCSVVWSSAATVDGVAAVVAADERVWLVDAGRLRGGSVAAPFVVRSALAVLLCRDAQEDLVQVPSRVASLQRLGAAVGVMVVGKPAHRHDELVQFFGSGLLWRVDASSQDLVTVAGAVLGPNRRARRTLAWRSALEVAAEIGDRVAAAAGDWAGAHDDVGIGTVSGDG